MTTTTFPDNVEFTATYVGTGFGEDDWKRNANLWNVVLKFEGRSYRTDYWMGAGLVDARRCSDHARPKPNERLAYNHFGPGTAAMLTPRAPTRDGVLGSLASDCSSADESFEDWCGDYGYDTDSRKAYATYEACRAAMFDLRTLLGSSYNEFLGREWDA